MILTRRSAFAAAMLAASAALSGASAQEWPKERPIQILGGFPTGAGTDIFARLLAEPLSKALGQNIVVDNRSGAGGNIGSEFVARSKPDGYTFLIGTGGTHAINASLYKSLNFDLVKDFEPVALLVDVPNVLIVNPKVMPDIKSCADLIAAAKKEPGKLTRENGITWDELDANELREVEPNLSRDYVKGVVIRENGHTTNPHRLVNTLLETFLHDGGRIERTRAVGFDVDGSRLRAIRTQDGLRSADAAVVAAGIWSRPLAGELGDKLPLETERGYHLMIRDPEVIPRLPITDADGKFVATPMELGLRAAGTVELAGLRSPPNWERARVLLRHLRQLFPALKENYSDERLSKWMGHRPSLPDSLPVIGRSRRSPDVIYAFGHGHVGMAAAPMTGKLVAELLSGKPPSVDLAPFSPGRFG